jgi:hypothetical protein
LVLLRNVCLGLAHLPVGWTAGASCVEAGGVLDVWAILDEDTCETVFGDRFYLYVKGLALDGDGRRPCADSRLIA